MTFRHICLDFLIEARIFTYSLPGWLESLDCSQNYSLEEPIPGFLLNKLANKHTTVIYYVHCASFFKTSVLPISTGFSMSWHLSLIHFCSQNLPYDVKTSKTRFYKITACRENSNSEKTQFLSISIFGIIEKVYILHLTMWNTADVCPLQMCAKKP